MKLCKFAWLATVLALILPQPALARTAEEVRLASQALAVVAVLRDERPIDQVFTRDYMIAVPPARLRAIAENLERSHGRITGAGAITRTSPFTGRFRLNLERASATATIRLDPGDGFKVRYFTLTDIVPAQDSAAALAREFAALPGKAGFTVARLGPGGAVPLASYRADESLAIGSTFKLWVLDALAEDIAQGLRRWDDVVSLGQPSLPSGILQDWPEDSVLTLESLATLMISISDNTATDALIRTLGRERIEQRILAIGHSAPGGLIPFLTTAEAFALKSSGRALTTDYARASATERRKMLGLLGNRRRPQNMDMTVLDSGRPAAIDTIEWFAAPADVIRVFDSLRRREDRKVASILGVAPHLPPMLRSRFAYAGYKGGSENGVISMNWLLRDPSGQWFAIAASWNNADAPVDNARFEQLVLRLVWQLP